MSRVFYFVKGKDCTMKIIADTMWEGSRITTLMGRIPKVLNAQLNTHGRLAISAESSRAIPVEKVIEQVMEDPYIPSKFTKNCRGMVSSEAIDFGLGEDAWLRARDSAVGHVRAMAELGIHKEIANRLLVPWQWQTVLITATEWDNFFHLRCHKDAQGGMRDFACAVRDAIYRSTPVHSLWHTPFVEKTDDYDRDAMISANRCKRVSYARIDSMLPGEEEFLGAEEMIRLGHMGPFEHQADYLEGYEGKFIEWVQFRKNIHMEHDPLG